MWSVGYLGTKGRLIGCALGTVVLVAVVIATSHDRDWS
jgi:hypothetical protein